MLLGLVGSEMCIRDSFYTMPRRYNDDQYLAGALGMYLTYINLFVFILRLMIALQGGGRRD